MVAELLKYPTGPVTFAIKQKLEAFTERLHAKVLGTFFGPGPVEAIKKRGDIDQLGPVVKKIGIGYFTAGHGTGDRVGHDALILP
jgi:hypothetical protein